MSDSSPVSSETSGQLLQHPINLGRLGIGGSGLLSPDYRIVPFDYESSGKLDHLVLFNPGGGAVFIVKKDSDGAFTPVFASRSGFGGPDRIVPFDYESSGKLDHLVLFRPGSEAVCIVKKDPDGTFAGAFVSGSGIGGYDLKVATDRIVPFDYDSSGKLDHLVLFRPGGGNVYIVKRNRDGIFAPVFTSGTGIGLYDLKVATDRIVPFDYDSSGKLDHLVLFRPGGGSVYIIKGNRDGIFAPVFTSGTGIGGYDLKVATDRIVPFDYDSSGKLDHLVLFRPGGGNVFIVKRNRDGIFAPVFASGTGIGGYDLKAATDRVVPFDYDSSGKLDHLVLFRPGGETLYIAKKGAGGTFAGV